MLKNKITAGLLLCPARAIPEEGAKGFSVTRGEITLGIFVVRKNGRLFGYKNRCPHTGAPLDWSPDQFLDKDNTYIQCSTHGALFQIEDGLCVFGPCVNQCLTKIEITIIDGDVYWQQAKT